MTREWYYQVMGQDLGPLSAAELKTKASAGQIQPDTLIRKGVEGKWMFGGNVKGLFPPPPEPPPPPKVISPTSPQTLQTISGMKPASTSKIPSTIAMSGDDDNDAQSPLLEFYDFVGFREAISPALYDAIKKFTGECGITIRQLNRRALAEFIQRPELASDILIGPIDPQVSQENSDGAIVHFSISNKSGNSIQLHNAAFLPKAVEFGSDPKLEKKPSQVDHDSHISARLDPIEIGKAIRIFLDVSIPSQGAREISIWFHERTPQHRSVRGQLLIGYAGELAMSEPFTIHLH